VGCSWKEPESKEGILDSAAARKQVTVVKGGTIFTTKTKKGVLEDGWVLIREGRISKIGTGDLKKELKGLKATVIDAAGKIVLPGLVNCHTHLYSTLARGIRLADYSPRNFGQCLEGLWWRLDRALTYEDCYWSALVGSLLSLKSGVTTLFDHHSSPYSIDRSLDSVAAGMADTGTRGSVCYEVSDRDGQDRASLGIYENVRFAGTLKGAGKGRIGAMMGLHASFTLSEPTILRARAAAEDAGIGFHLHVAEDNMDVKDSQKRYRRRVVSRLADAGVLSSKTLAIHCVHVNDSEIRQLHGSAANVVHCPRSNLSNAVGIAPVGKMFRHGVRIGFGSDGFGPPSILDDARAGLLSWRIAEGNPAAGWVETELMLFKNNPIIASALLDRKIGEIAEGYEGDLVVASYDPPTPLDRDNLWGHLVFGNPEVDTVIVGGDVVVAEGKSTRLDETKVFEKARALADRLWGRT
jgi:putative selenium metabolism protein SsnA